MENIHTAHLIYGPVGSGKSTYARKLAFDTNAIRFAMDEWMHALFADDRPQSMDLGWALSRVARCEALIWSTCEEILASGRDVVLELGATREADRNRIKALVEAAGHRISFHFIDADRDVRWQRVLKRNADKGQTYSFEVTPAMFDAMERYFEPPTEKELSLSFEISRSQKIG